MSTTTIRYIVFAVLTLALIAGVVMGKVTWEQLVMGVALLAVPSPVVVPPPSPPTAPLVGSSK